MKKKENESLVTKEELMELARNYTYTPTDSRDLYYFTKIAEKALYRKMKYLNSQVSLLGFSPQELSLPV